MKKILISLLTASLLFTSFGLVSAQQNRGEAPNTVVPSNRPEASGERAQEIVARIVSKLEYRLTRYGEFYSKVQARRNILAEEGADITELDRLMRLSEANLNTVRADLADMKAMLEGIDYSQPVRDTVRNVLTEIRDIRQSFNDLHQSMVDVVEEIKNLSN